MDSVLHLVEETIKATWDSKNARASCLDQVSDSYQKLHDQIAQRCSSRQLPVVMVTFGALSLITLIETLRSRQVASIDSLAIVQSVGRACLWDQSKISGDSQAFSGKLDLLYENLSPHAAILDGWRYGPLDRAA